MNGFIRTKDNRIYKVDSITYIEGDTPYYTVEGVDDFAFEQLINEADTIDELCDEFIVENTYYGQRYQSVYYDYEIAKQNVDVVSGGVLYGVIYTDKAPVPVAKMNKKGDLELI